MVDIEEATDTQLNTTGKSIKIEYLDRKILRLRRELASNISVTKSMQLFSGVVSFLSLIEIIFGYLQWDGIVMAVIFTMSFLMFSISLSTSKQKNLKAEIEQLKVRKSGLAEGPRSVSSTKHFDALVGININNLEEYYELVRKSNQRSFRASLLMSVLGVMLLFGGIMYMYLSPGENRISYIATFSGIVAEVISGLLFYLYNQTVIQLKDYHSSLIDVQNILLAFKLIDELKDEEHKALIMKQMIGFLVK